MTHLERISRALSPATRDLLERIAELLLAQERAKGTSKVAKSETYARVLADFEQGL